MIAKIDDAPPDLAAAAVGRPWNNPLFRRHLDGYENPDARGDWPVAIMNPRVLEAIGGRSRTVRFSMWTSNKQRRKHPDLNPGDYARVQRIFDSGEVFEDRYDPRAAVGFIEEDGRPWKAVAKSTSDGSQTYLLTLHRANPHNLPAARRDLKRIGREGE